ncbi:hypothetical protein ACHHYP_11593 [Achlya hypogyna]|uniref:Uncharacterized protein n=1 Tax=Achlya hypogyna TaxID=1202772 RepID=A0A1V9YJ00_ACHHY|nr:hypothetical protein ACHHYP_11593 [Achlya hypogyna]
MAKAASAERNGSREDGNAAQLTADLDAELKKSAALARQVAALTRELDTLKRMISITESHNEEDEAAEKELLEKFVEGLDLSTPALDIVPTVLASDFKDAQLISSSVNYRHDLGKLHGQTVIRKTFFSQTPDAKLLERFVGALDLPARLEGVNDSAMKLVATSGIGTRTPAIYMPNMAGGDLRHWLQATRMGPRRGRCAFAWGTRLRGGVSSVHELSYIHRDVNALHVLVDADNNAKLLINSSSRAVAGNLRHVERQPRRFCEKADIYSFGMTLIELDTHEAPYSHMKNSRGGAITDMMLMQLMKDAKPGDKLFSHEFKSSPAWYQKLARRCVDLDPEARPTAAEVARQLQEHIDSPVRAPSPHKAIELFVTVAHAGEIHNCAVFGDQTLFCRLTVGTETFTTSVKKRAGTTPIWNETFSFSNVHLMDMALEINIFEAFLFFSRQQIGRCQNSLYSLLQEPTKTELIPLSVMSHGKAQGYLAVKIKFAGPVVPYLDDYIMSMASCLSTIKGVTARSKEIDAKVQEARRIRNLLDKP